MEYQHKNCLECGQPLKRAKSKGTGGEQIYFLCGNKQCGYYGMRSGGGRMSHLGNMTLMED